MNYTLISFERKIASEDMRCDGIGAFRDMMDWKSAPKDSIKLDKKADMLLLLQNKEGIIKKGASYVEYVFVGDDGEDYLLNVSSRMVPVLKRNNFLPPQINQQIKSHEGNI